MRENFSGDIWTDAGFGWSDQSAPAESANHKKMAYICKMSPKRVQSPSLKYKAIQGGLTWPEANEDCKKRGGNLASANTLKKINAI